MEMFKLHFECQTVVAKFFEFKFCILHFVVLSDKTSCWKIVVEFEANQLILVQEDQSWNMTYEIFLVVS